MKLTQISVFLENNQGRLYEVCKLLGDNSINIRALTVAESKEYGILRLVVNDPVQALKVLKKANFTATETEVVAVEVEDQPGGLAAILKIFSSNKINVEYMYGFVEKASDKALMVFRFDDVNNALKVLQKNNISILNQEKIIKL